MLRDDDDFAATAISSNLNQVTQYGQTNSSYLQNFTEFPLVTGQIIDIMHCLFGGVTKKMCVLLFSDKFKDRKFSLYQHIKAINKKISELKPPSHFTTRLRSLEYIKYFRAHEFRSFILYFGPIILREFMPQDQLKNLILLSQISYLVCQPHFTDAMIKCLEKKVIEFLDSFSKIYGPEFVTINFHELVHLGQNIRSNGAIYSLSCFGFENFNKLLKETVHGSSRSDREMINRFNLLISSVRGFNFDQQNPIIEFVKSVLRSNRSHKTRLILSSGIRVCSKLKPVELPDLAYNAVYEIKKFERGMLYTSVAYDKEFSYCNSFIASRTQMKCLKNLKIYLVRDKDTEKIVLNGIQRSLRQQEMIFYELIGEAETVFIDNFDDYEVCFLVRDKLCVFNPNVNELY